MSDKELVTLDSGQFAKIDASLTAFGNGIFGLKGELNQIRHAIIDQTADTGKWLAAINETLSAGLAEVVKALREQQPPPPPAHSLEVKFMFVVKDNQADTNFSVVLGDVTDAEGNVIADAALDVAVASSDDTVVAVTFDAASKSGSVHFGNPGVASVTASVSSAGVLLGSGAADFTVTTGDPAAISSVGLTFDGLTEQP